MREARGRASVEAAADDQFEDLPPLLPRSQVTGSVGTPSPGWVPRPGPRAARSWQCRRRRDASGPERAAELAAALRWRGAAARTVLARCRSWWRRGAIGSPALRRAAPPTRLWRAMPRIRIVRHSKLCRVLARRPARRMAPGEVPQPDQKLQKSLGLCARPRGSHDRPPAHSGGMPVLAALAGSTRLSFGGSTDLVRTSSTSRC